MSDWRKHEEVYRGYRITVSQRFPRVAVITDRQCRLFPSQSGRSTERAVEKARSLIETKLPEVRFA